MKHQTCRYEWKYHSYGYILFPKQKRMKSYKFFANEMTDATKKKNAHLVRLRLMDS